MLWVRALQLNDLLSLGLHRVWKRAAVKWSGAAPGHAALDVCCGSGDLAFRLAAAVGKEGRVRFIVTIIGLKQEPKSRTWRPPFVLVRAAGAK